MGCKPFYGNTPLLVDLANIYFVYGLGIVSCNIAYINDLYCISLDKEGLRVCLLQNIFSK